MTEHQSCRDRLIPYKWELLVLLWIAFTFNQADRQIYNNLLPQIQPALQLSNEQAGLVATVFTAIYGILVPISGYAGDAFRRKWVIVGALALGCVESSMLTGEVGDGQGSDSDSDGDSDADDEDDEVTPETLVEAGVIKSADELVAILGRGDVD